MADDSTTQAPPRAGTPGARAEAVKEEARRLGFDLCRVAAAAPPDEADRLGAWLRAGYHGDMDWIARTREIRQDPAKKLPGAASVIVLARNYYNRPPAEWPAEDGKSSGAGDGDGAGPRGKTARYAWGRDYHNAFKKPLRRLKAFLDAMAPGHVHYASTDSGPVLERTWAERAGLGWTGKNSLILNKELGSYFLLATVITTVELRPDSPVGDHCGTCTACIDACPTDAITAPGVVDARRCISYLTIENRGAIPGDLGKKSENWVFGCDICQEVCPWNRRAPETSSEDFKPRPEQAAPRLDELLTLDDGAFRTRFAGTPLMRAKRPGMARNAANAVANIRNERGAAAQEGDGSSLE